MKIINLLNFIKIKPCHEFLFVAHVASWRESHAFLDIESGDEPSLPFSRTAELGLMRALAVRRRPVRVKGKPQRILLCNPVGVGCEGDGQPRVGARASRQPWVWKVSSPRP
jgi:hypothetical protein